MKHKRSILTLLSAPFRMRNYRAASGIIRGCRDPLDFLWRYALRSGRYPHTVFLRTPASNTFPIQIYSSEDTQTINEIFFRNDYPIGGSERVIVDFGSNIGVSALWYISRAENAFVYLFEPLPRNIQRLESNLTGYQGRFELNKVAVGSQAGKVEFGFEDSGRYGGIGRQTGQSLEVECVDSNDVLVKVIERHGRIDVLKIDIETMEKVVTERIPRSVAEKIDRIYVEYPFDENPLPNTHKMVNQDFVTHFISV